MKSLFSWLLVLFCISSAQAQLDLFKDIGDLFDTQRSGSDARSLIEVNGVLYFNGRSDKGYELWKNDGVNTTLVKDIWPGLKSSNPSNLTNFNGTLYFFANDGINGPALFKSDGTGEGTSLVKTISTVYFSNNEGAFNDFIALTQVTSDVLYFALKKDGNNIDLWRTDGTANGTFILKENFFPTSFTKNDWASLDSKLLFRVAGPTTALWVTDGTIEGTKKIEASDASLASDVMKTVGDHVYFAGYTTALGIELWKTDGTNGGTELVKEITAGQTGSSISNLIDFNGTLLFNVSNGPNNGLYSSDGTGVNTQLVNSGEYLSTQYKVIGDNIFFTKLPLMSLSYQLWVWNGTSKTASAIPGTSGKVSSGSEFIELDGLLYYNGPNGDLTGMQIWRTDGTGAGTFPITDFPYFSTGNEGLGASRLAKAGSYLYFVSGDEPHVGNELWKTDGVDVVQVTDQPDVNYGGYLTTPVIMDGNMYFTAGTLTYGAEPWKSSGTAPGTDILKDIVLPNELISGQYASSLPGNWISGNHHVFFTTHSPQYGLFSSDGTANGTVQISNTTNYIYDPLFFNDVLYYQNGNIMKVEAPYTTAQLITNVPGGAANLLLHKGSLYYKSFTAEMETIWRLDLPAGTPTKIVEMYRVGGIVSAGDLLYFMGDNGEDGTELWATDGNENGERLVKHIEHAGEVVLPYFNYSKSVGDSFYFVVDETEHGAELWKSDGTAEGTVLINDINEGAGSSVVNLLDAIEFDGKFYFIANDGEHGNEIWVTDGTEGGTMMLLDIYPGIYPSDPDNFLVHNDFLYFTAYDGEVRTLWKTNGLACGTIKVTNNTTVVVGGPSDAIVVFNDHIFVTGWSAEVGSEFFVHDPSTDLPIPEDCKIDVVEPAEQVITFEEIDDKVFGDAPFTITATSSSELPVGFTTNTPELVSITGSEVTILKAGTVTITAHQAGNESFLAAEDVDQTFCINPTKPTLSMAGSGTSVTIDSDIDADETKWFRNEIPITGESSQSIQASQNGSYTAIAVIGDCSSETSDDIKLIITGLGDDTDSSLRIYPNPASGKVYIHADLGTIEMLDMQGRSILSIHSNAQPIAVDIQSYAPGIYLVKLNSQVRKFVIR